MTLALRIRQRLKDLRDRDALRCAPIVSHREGVHYHLDGRPVVGFCSNDYLGLASDRDPNPTPADPGAGASRLICGDLPEHRATERALAAFAGTPDAVVFPSGFQLNVGVLPGVLTKEDVAHSDSLNHASLIDGLRLSRAEVRILPHLHRPPIAGPGHWWILESIYSMDGDVIDPAALASHAAAGGHLYIDEAHAIGLFPGGRGVLADGVTPDVSVGTLSKAFGCAGAFVAATADLCHLIRNRARSYVFSTGPSPLLAHAVHRALDRVTGPEGDRLREALWTNVAHLSQALGRACPSPSPIVPLVVGENRDALGLAGALLERGWHVQPIRPPTVPEGTARLRLTVSALHTPEQIQALARDIRELFDASGLPLSFETAAPPSPAETRSA